MTDNSIDNFYNDLIHKINKEKYSNSYIEFNFGILMFKSKLYKAIKEYDKDNTNNGLIQDFMKKYPNIIIKKIDNIKRGQLLTANSDGSRGCYKNGLYRLQFVVYFIKNP